MVTLADILKLPPTSEEAFVEFEALCRANLNSALNNMNEHENAWPHYSEYMSRVSEAAAEYGIDEHGTLRPTGSEFQPGDLDRFNQKVFRLITRAQIRAGRRTSAESVEIDEPEKAKLVVQIQRLKEQVEAAEGLDPERKKALQKKLDELLQELDGRRVNLARLMVVMAGAGALIAGAQNFVLKGPESIVAMLDTVHIITAKEEQRRELLERYRPPKAIEDKSKK